MYLSLYRKWRPRRFDEMVGQDHIGQALKSAFQNDKLSHAYLFTGSRGTGKTSAAKLLAKLVNCAAPQGGEPCNQCDSCLNSNQGHEELSDTYEIDAASNRGIDEIRELRENIKFSPLHRRKVYIIDEVHMLTNEAFNALLKTLEEPPQHVLFILATTDPRKIPSTVLSRCQRFDFHRLEDAQIVGQLGYIAEQEGFQVEDEALRFIAAQAAGGLRDAISLLDQCATAFAGKVDFVHVRNLIGGVGDDVLLELLAAGVRGELAKVLEILDNLAETGANLSGIGQDFARLLRDLVYAKEAPRLLEGKFTQGQRDNLIASAANLSSQILGGGLRLFLDTEVLLRQAPEPRIVFEAALIEFSLLASGKPIALAPHLEDVPFSGGAPGDGGLAPRASAVSPAQSLVASEIVAPLPFPSKTIVSPQPAAPAAPAKGKPALPSDLPPQQVAEDGAWAAEMNRRWQQLALRQTNPIFKTMLRQCSVAGCDGNKLLLFTQNPSAADRLAAKRESILPLLAELAPHLQDFAVSEAKSLKRDTAAATKGGALPPAIRPANQPTLPVEAKPAAKPAIPAEPPSVPSGEEPLVGIALREFEGVDVSDEFMRKDDN